MELTFLGTGAADVYPSLKEDQTIGIGDKDVRRYSSTLLDGKILFDCSIFTVQSITVNGFDLSKISSLFITHFHGDHCDFGAIQQLAFHTEKVIGTRLAGKRLGRIVIGGGKLRLLPEKPDLLLKLQKIRLILMRKE